MSSATPFALGLGGGLALWKLTRASSTTKAPAGNRDATCLIRLDATGLTVDGVRVGMVEAVERARRVGSAQVALAQDASASAFAELMTSLRAANITAQVRAADVLARNATSETQEFFTLITYARGIQDKPTVRYFRAESRIAWSEARDRLAANGLLDLALAGRTREPGGWMLSIDPKDFRSHRAEPLPGGPRNSVISTIFTLAVYPEGVGGPKKVRWFKASRPTMWDSARDRLAEAGLLDLDANKAMDRGYWILVTSPEAFKEDRAEPLPTAKRARGAAAQRYTLQGRTILRDGEAILYVDRVDLGDERFAISPHHADLLTQRMVRLLNRHGAR
jgi:sulfur transfer complex TusBCD TusB component (DsrH family)